MIFIDFFTWRHYYIRFPKSNILSIFKQDWTNN